MFIRYVFIPHLEDIFLDLGPDVVGLCSREFTMNVITNSSTMRYEQIAGDPLIIDTTDPFNPVVNYEQVRGRFVIKGYADDGVTDTLNILSGPIDELNSVNLVTKEGLPPVNLSISGIYTQKVNEFFWWRDSGAKIQWSKPDFLPNQSTELYLYRLDNKNPLITTTSNTTVLVPSQVPFGIEVGYNIGGNTFTRSGGNWFFVNNGQADERYPLNCKLTVNSQLIRLEYIKTLNSYVDRLRDISMVVISTCQRVIYSVVHLSYVDKLSDSRLTSQGTFSRTIFIDKIIN